MKRLRASVLLLALCVSAVYGTRALAPHPDEVLKKRLAVRSKGDEKAPVWITEYFDYQCPPCAMANKLLNLAMTRYPGKIYLQVRYFPMPAHVHAVKAAVYAECASKQKGRFWDYHEALFDNQRQWAADPYPELRFTAYAETAGLDVKGLEACVQRPETEASVRDERKKGEEIGVKGTPSFFVNGKLLVGVNALAAELDTLLGEASQ